MDFENLNKLKKEGGENTNKDAKVNLFRLVVFSMLISALFFTTKSFACVGARPLAMGGAFVAVADDANAVYWNPAGLTQVEGREITMMHTVNNRKVINYQDFFGFAQSIKNISIGINYIHSIPNREYDEDPGVWWKKETYDQKWYGFSFATKLKENMSLGVTVKQYKEELKDEYWYKWSGYDKASATGNAIGIDLGYLYKIDEKVSIGLLVQDANKPKVEFKYQGVKIAETEHLRNIRPGIAYKPNENTTIAMDIYYFTLDNAYDEDVKGQSDVRVGVEFLANENWALRAGHYGDAFNTIGFGYKKKGFQIDYALLSDFKVPGEGLGTHILSISWKFGKEKPSYKEEESEEIKCPKCNVLNPKTNIFCTECGAKLKKLRR